MPKGESGGMESPRDYLMNARDGAEVTAEESRRFLFELAPRLEEIGALDAKLKAVIDYLSEEAATAQDPGDEKGTPGNDLRTIGRLLDTIDEEYKKGENPAWEIEQLRKIVDSKIHFAQARAKGHLAREAKDLTEPGSI
ncbi:MAG: hypothetical protein Q7S48_03790 [bacterium]|nr:hypothetical protein [bacterium]